MFLSHKQIKEYQNDGVIIVKDVFKDWIEPLRKGFQKVLDSPSKHGRENVLDDNGRFFEDYCNWERIEEFKDCLYNSAGAQIVAEATNSKSTQIFHEHIFIKDPGTHKETPWHQDMPYYCVDGNDTGSFWIPLDEVDHKNNIKLIYSATSASLGNKCKDKNLSPYAFTKSKNLELLENLKKLNNLYYLFRKFHTTNFFQK